MARKANKYGIKCDECESRKKINKYPARDRGFIFLCPECFAKFKKEVNRK